MVSIEISRKPFDEVYEGDNVGILLSGVDYKALNKKSNYVLVPTDTTHSFAEVITLFHRYAKIYSSEGIADTATKMFTKAYVFDEKENYQKAMHYYQKAAFAGSVDAVVMIGNMYYEGRGVDVDYCESMEWFKNASAAGCADAMNTIGLMYYRGEGVDVDFEKAAGWWSKAALNGDAMAKNNLAYMYEKGCGVQQSFEKAIELYSVAAAKGIQESQEALKRLIKNNQIPKSTGFL